MSMSVHSKNDGPSLALSFFAYALLAAFGTFRMSFFFILHLAIGIRIIDILIDVSGFVLIDLDPFPPPWRFCSEYDRSIPRAALQRCNTETFLELFCRCPKRFVNAEKKEDDGDGDENSLVDFVLADAGMINDAEDNAEVLLLITCAGE
eukprot:269447_1